MRSSAREYLSLVVRTWWARVSLVAGVLGLLSPLANIEIPSVVWWVVVGGSIVVAQFTAFHQVREQRDAATTQLAAPPETEQAHASFAPDLLDGQLFPSSAHPVIESSERAFVIRAGVAFGQDGEVELQPTELQQRFENAVASSSLEGWFQSRTRVFRRVPEEHWWRPVDPTRSQIVTLARPTAQTAYDAFTIAGQAALNLKPGLQPWHPGYGVLLASAVIRPGGSDAGFHGCPLSFEELYEALIVIQAALIDEIAPPVLKALGLADCPLRACSVMALANAGSVEDYVSLRHQNWRRAEGSSAQPALYGHARSEEAARDTGARDQEVRRWLSRFLADSGFTGFESDLARLEPPKLASPIPT